MGTVPCFAGFACNFLKGKKSIKKTGRLGTGLHERLRTAACGGIRSHVVPGAHPDTDESKLNNKFGRDVASHGAENQSQEEHARTDEETVRLARTNTVDDAFRNRKRRLGGTHQHLSGKHVSLHLANFHHKYNTQSVSDGARSAEGIQKIEGKRLLCRHSCTWRSQEKGSGYAKPD